MDSGQERKDHYGKKTLFCKSMKGHYNSSCHANIFVSFLPGRSAKALQSLQNEMGRNASRLLSSSGLRCSSLGEANSREWNSWAPRVALIFKVNYVQSETLKIRALLENEVRCLPSWE